MFRRVYKKEKYEYTKEVIQIEELVKGSLIINLTNNNVFEVVSPPLFLYPETCFQLMKNEDLILRGFSEIEKDFSLLIKID